LLSEEWGAPQAELKEQKAELEESIEHQAPKQ
jgi:hypothetical protein